MKIFLNRIYFLFILYFICSITVLGQKHYDFEHITKKDGLSQGTVNFILEDSKGYMWFGTNDGLNKYSGSTFKIYRHNNRDSLSINNNEITSIVEDNAGRIWVSSAEADLQYIDPVSGKFFSYKTLFPECKYDLSSYSIQKLYYQNPNILWVGSVDYLFKFDIINHTITQFSNPNKYSDVNWGKIKSIVDDSDGRLWFGTEFYGIYYIELATNSLFHVDEKPSTSEFPTQIPNISTMTIGPDGKLWIGILDNYIRTLDRKTLEIIKPDFKTTISKELLNKYQISSLASDQDSMIWVGTIADNIQIINVFTKEFTTLSNNPSDSKSLLSESIKSIYIAKDKSVWVGDNGFGINYYFPFAKHFNIIKQNQNLAGGLTFSSVRTIYKDKSNNLWVGGYGGLDVLDENLKLIDHYFDGMPVYYIFNHNKNEDLLWVGFEGSGLVLFDKKLKKSIRTFYNTEFHPNEFLGSVTYSIAQANDESIWVGTEKALNYINCNTFNISTLQTGVKSKTINAKFLRAIFNDSKNRLWVGGIEGGLSVKFPNEKYFKSYRPSQNKTGAISSNKIYCIIESKDGIIYIGTHNGLNIFDEKTSQFKMYDSFNGFPNDVIYGILEDSKTGNLWLSTNEGLCCFNPITGICRNYNEADGLSGNEFNSGAFYKDDDGNMYFGGVNGITYFNPEDIRDNLATPKLHFTYFKKGNEFIKLNQSEQVKTEISIDYSDHNIRIGFEALNYYKPEKTEYSYRLSGISEESWVGLGNTKYLDLNQLRSGKYTLSIIASNNDHIWNKQGIQLTINVFPPFWRTWWFMSLGSIFIILIIFFFFNLRIKLIKKNEIKLENEILIRTQKLKESNKELKKEIDERKRIEAELIESNKTKDKFFSIISHDLKSPFNALLGFTELISEDYDIFTETEKKSYFKTFKVSLEEVYKLIQNLLTWSRSQSGNLQFSPQLIDLVPIIELNLSIAKQQADKKQITLSASLQSKIYVWADSNMVDTVVRNLISNAIKFTNRNGTIEVTISNQADDVMVCIRDSGIGMSEETIQKLFLIEEKLSTQGTDNEAGTGLGLILCKEFVEKNNGTISVKSSLGNGTTFCVTLPKRY